jgi:rod shape-determining protein MreC
MPVRSPDGLVGRIIDAGELASRVLLVSDRANIVPARLLRSGIPVISQGRGDGTIDVRPLEVGRNPFRRGDIIITSGTGGLYPPLVPIARIVKLDDDGAVAIPLADPANTSFAIVEPPFEPAAIAADQPASTADAP